MSADINYPRLQDDEKFTDLEASKPCAVEFRSPLYRLLKTHQFTADNLMLDLEELEGPVGRLQITWKKGTSNPRLTLVENIPDTVTHSGCLEHNISDECLAGDHTGQRLRAMRHLADGTRHPCCTDCMPYRTHTRRGAVQCIF